MRYTGNLVDARDWYRKGGWPVASCTKADAREDGGCGMRKKNLYAKIGERVSTGFQNGIYKPSEDYSDDGVRIVRINDYGNGGTKHFENLRRVKLSNIEIERFSLKADDILVNRVNSLSHIGKSCIIEELKDSVVFESNMMRIRLPAGSGISPLYLFTVLNSARSRGYLKRVAKPAVAQASINQEDIKSLSIYLPNVKQQTAIADLLSTWDAAIEKTERLIAVKEARFSWLLSRLICCPNQQQGHIRDFTKEVSRRNREIKFGRVLSVTNHNGFVLPEDQFKRRVASSDLSNYKVVTRGQYAYNPSRINVGSIARLNDWNKGVLSPMYVVFELNEKKVVSDFFLHWLSSHEAKERIRKSAQGSVRETVSFTDFGSIKFPFPSLEQQRDIAAAFNIARYELNLLKKQLEAFHKQKRGLMQKLLTGEWRVNITGVVDQ